MWLVLLAHKGGYRFHSVHKDEDKARHWCACKTYDGEDAVAIKLDKDAVDEIIRCNEES